MPDRKVDVADMQLEASNYGAGTGSLLYQTFFDGNLPQPDGRIDILDVQFVYGRFGSTCQVPIPPEPAARPVATTPADAAVAHWGSLMAIR